ncbi:MAG: hypothetical protein ACKO3W_07485 [bacterium]
MHTDCCTRTCRPIHILTLIGACSLVMLASTSGCSSVSRAELQAARDTGVPVMFTDINIGSPNSAGGQTFEFRMINTSKKALKYVEVTVVGYNQVADPVPCRVRRSMERPCQLTGPFQPGSPGDAFNIFSFRNLWYDARVVCAQFVGARITYMDGTSVSYDRRDIHQLLSEKLEKPCGVRGY